MGRARLLISAFPLLFLFFPSAISSPEQADIELFFEAARPDQEESRRAMEKIAPLWRDNYAAMILDLIRVVQGRGDSAPSRLIWFLEDQTGKHFRGDLDCWWEWVWTLPYEPHPQYALFKGVLYSAIDPQMGKFFPPGAPSLIRLDEIDWGGVKVNGIPPLDYPRHIPASEAQYLDDDNTVFGLSINGESRAYPKRILAWHELARDRLGEVELTIVYCTLCGTVIPYESEVGGKILHFGTSGFLYRSNKLMFDTQDMNLWSALEGKPVVGNLVGKGLRLRSRPVVTTTWEEWRTEHPKTTVLSPDTGYDRDYSEGAAYGGYFSTDRLMFPVSKRNKRLKNKDEVLVMRLRTKSGEEGEEVPLAIAVKFLRKQPVYHTEAAGYRLVVITSPEGANRVYEAGEERFVRRLQDGRARDAGGGTWEVTEEALVQEGDRRRRLPRVPAQRAFWFGWYAQFPETLLIK